MWYTGAAFIGVLGVLALRLGRKTAEVPSLADSFEIIEESDQSS